MVIKALIICPLHRTVQNQITLLDSISYLIGILCPFELLIAEAILRVLSISEMYVDR